LLRNVLLLQNRLLATAVSLAPQFLLSANMQQYHKFKYSCTF
jgi:hypothetical protein